MFQNRPSNTLIVMDPSKPQFNPFFNFSQPSSHNPNDDAQNTSPLTPMYPNRNFPMMNPNNFSNANVPKFKFSNLHFGKNSTGMLGYVDSNHAKDIDN